MNYQNTRRVFTQENKEVVIKQSIIPEFSSGSSTHVVTQQPRQAWKTLKQVQGLSNFIPLRGFTLIELLVVVLIIGILSAIALPQYQKAVEKTRISQALTFLDAVYKSHQLCVLQHGANSDDCYLGDPTVLASLEIELPGKIETEDCASDTSCIKTKDWDFGTDDSTAFFAFRVKNGGPYPIYVLFLNLTNDNDDIGKVMCGGDFCSSLCGDDPCYLN